jgi:RiboL-PSP-HEPN
MKAHTDSFINYKTSSQGHIDFVVVVCHAVPALKADLAQSAATLANVPDHFKLNNNSKSWIAAKASGYTNELARSTLLTVFSYFEGYIKDTLKEIVDFHGGEKALQDRARNRSKQFMIATSGEIVENKRKLQDNPTSAKFEKYRKFGRLLDDAGYRFPTDLLSNFGVRFLLTKTDDKKGMRAFEIPEILSECLLLNVDASEAKMFETVRGLRNKLAHGRPQPITLAKSLQYASELHTWASKIDKHVCDHFLVIQVV